MSPEQAGFLRKQDTSHALLFWSALPSAHGAIQSNFNNLLVSLCVSTMGGAWTHFHVARKARTSAARTMKTSWMLWIWSIWTGVPWRRLMGSPARRCSRRAKPWQPRNGSSRANHSRCGFSRAGRLWVWCCVAVKVCLPMWTKGLSPCVWWCGSDIFCTLKRKAPVTTAWWVFACEMRLCWSVCTNFTVIIPRARRKCIQMWHSKTVAWQLLVMGYTATK